jgi:hypothetical protein
LGGQAPAFADSGYWDFALLLAYDLALRTIICGTLAPLSGQGVGEGAAAVARRFLRGGAAAPAPGSRAQPGLEGLLGAITMGLGCLGGLGLG